MASEKLTRKLNKISKVFDIDEVVNIQIDDDYIKKYYKVNRLAYSLFHTRTDLIYMGISRDGKYKPDDLLEHARFVEKYIKKTNARNVLELATGRGANSNFLARRNLGTKFYGIDISKAQLEFAIKKSKQLKNYYPTSGNYHNLNCYEPDFFDLVFIVEALCYSLNKQKVLREVKRVLKPSGYFIIFDGYRNRKTIDKEENLACDIMAKGMSLETFEFYDDLVNKIEKSGFEIEFEENVSKYVIPTMERFEKLAKIYFALPSAVRILGRLFPKIFIYNTISAYLMPTLVKDKLASYMITVLKRG